MVDDIHAEIDLNPGYWWRGKHEVYSEEWWSAYEKAMEREAQEFVAFVRDHRSQDANSIRIVRSYHLECKFCGYKFPDGFNGIADCCQQMIDAQGIQITDIVKDKQECTR